ncbi:hypothetical protein AVEN_88499-1, partial [Araneus ventricosus]
MVGVSPWQSTQEIVASRTSEIMATPESKFVLTFSRWKVQLSLLKESLMSVQKIPAGEHLNGIEIFNNICLSQVSVVCNALQTAFSKETIVVAFLNAILSLEKSLSLCIASALVKHIIYPQ